jgi:hypothetical protein
MKRKEPKNYTLADIRVIADKQFLPPWSIIDYLGKLEQYVISYQENKKKQERRTG